ncbi:MAG: DUF5050 domain-containing protein [Ruminococcaceae bacterium]|nr:DUF5050 domain-containing protein [Oscillospiraceae bacterium]
MKKFISIILVLILSLTILAGCGGDSAPTPDEKPSKSDNPTSVPAAPAPKEPEITEGFWVVESLVMDGAEFSGQDITDLFGKFEDVMALQFKEDGSFVGIIFQDFISGSFKKTETGYEIDVADEKAKASFVDGKLVMELDGGAFTLKSQENTPASFASNPWFTYAPNFDSEQTMAMSNFMGGGFYYIEDNVIYGLSHSQSNNGALAAISFHMKGDFPEIDEIAILDGDGCARYITKYGDYLYYIMDYESIRRIKLDGSDMEIIFEGPCDNLQIHEDRIYFSDEDYWFLSCDMDGGNIEAVVDKEVYYPYFIGTDWLVFQDDADDESLHIYNTTHYTEMNITYFPCYNPVMDGKYLYFVAGDDGSINLCRVDMSDPYTFYFDRSELSLVDYAFMIDEEEFYGPNNDKVLKEDWKKLGNDEDTLSVMEKFVSGEYTIYHEFDEEGYISAKYIMSKTRHGGTSFR